MATTRATVHLAMQSGEPKDAVINVWHFTHIGSTEQMGGLIAEPLMDFYEANNEMFSPQVARAIDAHYITLADVSAGGSGADDDTVSAIKYTHYSGAAWGGVSPIKPLPNEVAMCLSFAGDLGGLQEEVGATRPKARRRGRIYLGPLNVGVMDVTGGPLFFTAQTQVTLDRYKAMTEALSYIDDVTSPGTGDVFQLRHVIYSPTTAQTHEVKSAWVDNAPDIIRTRGISATNRATVSVEQPYDAP